jgi:hypothetical protein
VHILDTPKRGRNGRSTTVGAKTDTVDTKDVTEKTLAVIRRRGARGGHFRTSEIREELGYSETSDEAHYMHNLVQRLKKQGVLHAAAGRKRNQYLTVASEEQLRRTIERAALRKRRPVTGAVSAGTTDALDSHVPLSSGPPRVVYLEERVDRVERAIEDLVGAIGDLTKGQDAIRHRVDDLIEMWS